MDLMSLIYDQTYYDKSRLILDDLSHGQQARKLAAMEMCWKLFRRSGALITVQVDNPTFMEIAKSRKWSTLEVVGNIGEDKCEYILGKFE